jgi:hypothetical protein
MNDTAPGAIRTGPSRSSVRDPHPIDVEQESGTTRSGRSRAALIVFVAIVVAALPFYLRAGENRWFFFDEWDFLSTRDAGDLHDLFRPHNEHWSTLPILLYRAVWRFVGLHDYSAYQALTITLHLVAAVLLRTVMRRADVGPWMATIVSGAFVLFGAASENILWAFQIGFVGSLVFGIGQLILADHPGPFDRRDALGIVCGLAALMCSGVGVMLVVAVGMAALLKRGIRIAAVHTLPLAAAFGVWFWLIGGDAFNSSAGHRIDLAFIGTGFSHAFRDFSQGSVGALVLAALIVTGLVVTVRRAPASAVRILAVPVSMAISALLFLLISGLGRASAFGPSFAEQGRYTYLVIALFLPVVAVAADAFGRRSRWAFAAVTAILLLGVPGNVRAADDASRYITGSPELLLNVPHHEFARQVPRSFAPLPGRADELTVGWLLDALDDGRLPEPPAISERDRRAIALRLSLEPLRVGAQDDGRQCRFMTGPEDHVLEAGDRFGIAGAPVDVRLVENGEITSGELSYHPETSPAFEVLRGPIEVRVIPEAPGVSALCE